MHMARRTMEQAFQDLRALMAKAQDMVQLAQRFRYVLSWRAGAVLAFCCKWMHITWLRLLHT